MIVHLDMDAFFASVEQMDDPELRGKPVIIGGGQRGVVATASYEARVYGIHSAMPMAIARRLCPQGIFLPGNGKRYSELSHLVMDCLGEFGPVVEKASIDEAYLAAPTPLPCPPEAYAHAIKDRVATVTGGLTCSIGMAPVKFLAKICSDLNKPDGIFVLDEKDVDAFLVNMPIEKLPGVGPGMSASLRKFGIGTAGDLRELGREFLVMRYGKWGNELHDRARGLDSRTVHENLPPKSESAERTFAEDITDREVLRSALLAHAERVTARLRANRLAGRIITLKVKYADFRQFTRTCTLAERTNATLPVFRAGCELLAAERICAPVRLIGLGVSGFEERATQLHLPGFEPSRDMRSTGMDRVVDEITAKFGRGAVTRASALGFGKKGNHHFGG